MTDNPTTDHWSPSLILVVLLGTATIACFLGDFVISLWKIRP